MSRVRLAVLLLGLSSAAGAAPELAPYRPLYPGLYLETSIEIDPRDESFDDDGDRRDSALPLTEGASELPERRLEARLRWSFPLFEQEGYGFLSSRLHTARVTLRYADVDARGVVAKLAQEDPLLEVPSSGLGDTTLEIGSYLSGSANWRAGRTGPLSTLLLLGLTIPTGEYDADAPANPGTHHPSVHLKLGAHGTPWGGALLDAGLAYRVNGRDEEPQFGAQAPARPGDELLWDLQLAQRIGPGVYGLLGVEGQAQSDNQYDNPRLMAPLQASLPLADRIALPGRYRDQGTEAIDAALGLRWFVTQRLVLGAHYSRPLSGQSGVFEVDLADRLPAGCNIDAPTCVQVPAGSTPLDGLGSARRFASDRIGLSLTYQFGLGDPYACPGCSD